MLICTVDKTYNVHNVPSLTNKGKGSSGLFTTLSTHTCTCLHWFAVKLAKVFKISHRNRPKITKKCCWFSQVKNVVKNTEKIRFICGTI